MIKNIFFDFNGTLLNDVNLCINIEQKLCRIYSIKEVDKDVYLNNFCFPVINFYKCIGFDFEKIDYNILSKQFMAEFYDRFDKETSLFEGVTYFLKKLKYEGYKLFVISATKQDDLENQIKDKGIHMFFDDLIGSKNVLAHGKIDYAKEFIKSKNIDPKESVFIGDTIHDFEVGEALNMNVLLVTFGHNSRKLLENTGCKLCSSFEEVYSNILKMNK